MNGVSMKIVTWIFVTFFSMSISAADIGVVMLHAKGSSPDASKISDLISAMREQDMEVLVPEMPWSDSREYNASYMDAMNEIEKEVTKFKANSATSVFVAGHSLS